MPRPAVWITIALISVGGGLLAAIREAAPPALQEKIRAHIERGSEFAETIAAGERIHASRALSSFYEQRGYLPAWIEKGSVAPRTRKLVKAIIETEREGLDPSDYHLSRIEGLMAGSAPVIPETDRLTALDLLLTDAFLVLGAHLVNGRVDPVTFDPEWIAVRREVDLVALLARTIESGDLRGALDSLRPRHPGYTKLVNALKRYRRITSEGGWPEVPGGPSIKPGELSSRLPAIRARLSIEEGALDPLESPERYDEFLEAAIRDFQRRHGLDDDGVIGSRTLEEMNTPAARRARQIELSLERWRWIPRDLGERHLLVNIPAFHLYVSEDGRTVIDMKVIVGRVVRRTPVFSDTMRYLVLNPSWEVPPTILRQDKLPEIRKDPEYVAKNNMRLFQLIDGGWRQVDPHDVDWSKASASTIRLRQDPGPNNALGRVKFMFPNAYNVYLHDTPARELFAKSQRDFSSGCIRIEKPLELAEYLLREAPAWSPEKLQRELATGREQTVVLPKPLSVHLLYWTAFVGEDGAVEFRRDIYGRDAKLEAALNVPPPAPTAP